HRASALRAGRAAGDRPLSRQPRDRRTDRHRRSLECDRRRRDGRRRRTLLAHELRSGSVSGPNRGPAMHSIDLLYTLSGFCVGALVGLTGVGGGSLMTPVLILLFGVQPTSAVGTDLLYAAITKG